MNSLAWVLGLSLLFGCGGKSLETDPTPPSGSANGSSVEPSQAPQSSTPQKTTCANVEVVFKGADGNHENRTVQTRYDLRNELQGYWLDCQGPFWHGFYDSSRGEVGILVEGDNVDTVVQKQDGTFARERSLGTLVIENGSTFKLTTGTHWAYFSMNGEAAFMGREDLGSAGGGYLIRAEKPFP